MFLINLLTPERKEAQPPLDWKVRKGIALGAAKGLAYLYYECLRKFIHRDVKAANILLDEDFKAVVADFSLAVDCDNGDIVAPVKGTIAHIAPEHFATGKCSVKTDVFGYGVFLLELITAKKSYGLSRGASESDAVLLNMVSLGSQLILVIRCLEGLCFSKMCTYLRVQMYGHHGD